MGYKHKKENTENVTEVVEETINEPTEEEETINEPTEEEETITEPTKADDREKKFTITGCEYLNLRPKPSTENKPVMIIDKYDTIVVERKLNDEWSKVTVSDRQESKQGYVMNDFIKEV